MAIILAAYLGIAVLTFFFMGNKAVSWDQSKTESIAFASLWPIFYLMLIDWGFGDLVDRATAKLFRKR